MPFAEAWYKHIDIFLIDEIWLVHKGLFCCNKYVHIASEFKCIITRTQYIHYIPSSTMPFPQRKGYLMPTKKYMYMNNMSKEENLIKYMSSFSCDGVMQYLTFLCSFIFSDKMRSLKEYSVSATFNAFAMTFLTCSKKHFSL